MPIIMANSTLQITGTAANEGGQIDLAIPSSGTSLTDGFIKLDSYQNLFRIYANNGTNVRTYSMNFTNDKLSGFYQYKSSQTSSSWWGQFQSSNDDTVRVLFEGVGNIYALGNITAFWSSDRRQKKNIKNIENALEKVNKINGVTFDWTEEYLLKRGDVSQFYAKDHEAGVIAQEIEEVLPEVVTTRSDGFMAVQYEKIVPLLIEAIKEQNEQVKSLEGRIKILENMISVRSGGL